MSSWVMLSVSEFKRWRDNNSQRHQLLSDTIARVARPIGCDWSIRGTACACTVARRQRTHGDTNFGQRDGWIAGKGPSQMQMNSHTVPWFNTGWRAWGVGDGLGGSNDQGAGNLPAQSRTILGAYLRQRTNPLVQRLFSANALKIQEILRLRALPMGLRVISPRVAEGTLAYRPVRGSFLASRLWQRHENQLCSA
jgi:hypothetical protein